MDTSVLFLILIIFFVIFILSNEPKYQFFFNLVNLELALRLVCEPLV